VRRAFTLVEIAVFFLIAVLVVGIAMDFLSGSSRILKRASRTAGGQVELQVFVETLATDVEELAYFRDQNAVEVRGGGAGKLELVVLSNRVESGLPPAPAPELRVVTYEFVASSQKERSKVTRAVARLKPTGRIDERDASSPARHVADSLSEVKVVPFIWGAVKGSGWRLAPAGDALGKEIGSAAACVSLTVKVSEPSGDAAKEGGDIALTTRLWTRGRLLALTQEGRPQ
jgi:hypothetical protein